MAKYTPGNLLSGAELRFGGLGFVAFERLQFHVDLVVIDAPSVVGLLAAANLIHRRSDKRELFEFRRQRPREAQRFIHRGARHGRHVNDEVAFLEIRQEFAAEEWQGSRGRDAQQRRAPDDRDWAQHQAAHQPRNPLHPSDKPRSRIVRRPWATAARTGRASR
jgi:hypothetical protein